MCQSSSPSPTQTNTNTTELPEWARGYAKDTLYQASQLTDVNKNPYKAYDQNRIAGFTPMQEQAQQTAAGMQAAPQLGQATTGLNTAMQGALGTSYQGGQFGNQFQSPQNLGYNAQTFQANQMGPAQQVGTQDFRGNGTAQSFMNPYMQNVVDIQKREAQRQSAIQGTNQQAQATAAGAFGGGRDAIMRAERERNLGQQMGDIQAQGSNAAFQQAQQQFNAQNQLGLQAQMANQGAGLTVGGQNLNALQQTNLANQAAQNQAAQFGAGQGLQAAGLGAQYGLAGQQLGEQSRQYGAGLGLQGLQTGISAANSLAGVGQNQYQQNMGINQLQNQYGTQQQQQNQRPLDQAYQDFLNQQNYPYKQLGYMSDMVRGLPLGQQGTAQMYQAPPSMMQNVAAAGMGAYGLSKLMAGGGQVKGYASGGILNRMDDPNRMAASVNKLTDEQLQDIIQHPSSEAEKQAAETELATRASENKGLASAYNMLPTAAGGGMVAFGRGGIMHFAGDEDSQVTLGTSTAEGNAGEEEARAQAAEDAQDEQSQDSVNMANPTSNGIATIGMQALMRDQNRQAPNFTDINDPVNGAKSYMDTMRNLAGPDTYVDASKQVNDIAAKSAAALEQGKGLAALSAMGAIVQGPNFMRALGGAGQAFADSYKGAVAAHQAATMEAAKMKINLANGKRAENLGLAKDAISSFQAAQANKIAMFKAEGERDQRLATSAARLARAVAPPKPATPVKPSVQAEGVAINAASLREQHPDWSPTKINAAALSQYMQQAKPPYPVQVAGMNTSSAQDIAASGQLEKATGEAAKAVRQDILYNPDSYPTLKGLTGPARLNEINNIVRQSTITPQLAATRGAPTAAPRAAPASQIPSGTTFGKVVPGKGTEVIKDGKVIGYAN